MIVQCPSCRTKYNFEHSKYKENVKVRCTRCEHIFTLSSSKDKSLCCDPPSAANDREQKKETEAKAESRRQKGKDTSMPEPGKRSSSLSIIILVLTAVAVIILGLYLILSSSDTGIRLPFMSTQNQENEVLQIAGPSDKEIIDISLENIRHYFVDNDKVGQLFVIEGQALNSSDRPKSMIKLRASLYDDQGNVLVEKDFLCGNRASLLQLQTSSQQELDAVLYSRLGILTSNRHVEPGTHVPFMVVFSNPPHEMQEFALEVIEAHDPVP